MMTLRDTIIIDIFRLFCYRKFYPLTFVFFFFLISPLPAYKGEFTPSPSRSGQTGLIELPNARMFEEGTMILGANYAYPNLISHLTLQPFTWFQGSVRYTATQDLWNIQKRDNNRNLDAKLRFFKETRFIPETSLGFVDGLGTPHLRGPYLVFSKRYYDLDFTLGFAWGRYGLRNLYRDPYLFLKSYDAILTQEQKLNFTKNLLRRSHFIPFGGIEYATPFKGLNLKIEAVGDPSTTKKLNKYKHAFPVNIGANFQPFDWLQLSAGLQNGHQWMVGLSLLTNINKNLPQTGKPTKPPLIQIRTPKKQDTWNDPVEADAPSILAFLTQHGFKVERLALKESKLILYFENTKYLLPSQSIGRLSRRLTQIAPKNIHFFEIIMCEKGLHLQKTLIHRANLEKLSENRCTIEELYRHLYPSEAGTEHPKNSFYNRSLYPIFGPYITPKIKQSLFDQNKPMRIDAGLGIGSDIEFGHGFLASAELGITLLSSLDDLKIETPHHGQRVRSDIKNYVKHGRQNLAHLQLDKLFQLSPNLFARSSIGYFEQIFGGGSGEILYRPYNQNWAIGMEINHLWQRGFKQLFNFQKYNVTNGHVSLYNDLPFLNLASQLHIGRYLAKDWGGTLEITKRFDTGIEIGVFGTFTNINKKKYDETKFDKGLWIKIPLEWLFGSESKQSFDYMLRPLSKDGGQRAIISNRLHKITSPYTKKKLIRDFGAFMR